VNLHIPERDAEKKKGRFLAKVDRLVVGLSPAEMGYIVLPMSCLPDTAVSPDYKVGLEISAKPLGKAQRVRSNDGGGAVDVSHLRAEMQQKIEDLKQLPYSTKKTGLRATVIETQLSVMSGKVGALTDLQPGWTSLWSLKDHLDDRLLLQRYWESMKVKVLPALNRTTVYQPLLEITQKKFNEAGYELRPIEATFIAKLLTLILEYAAPSQATHGSHGHLAAGIYNIMPLLNKERLASDEPISLPRWVSTMLRTIVKDERAIQFPVQAVLRFAYNELLADAATHAFTMIETATGEDLGDEKEQAEYIDQTVRMLAKDAPLDFSRVYMPLVLGGVIVYDRVMMPDEKLGELLEDMRDILNERKVEQNPDNEIIFNIAARLIDQAMMKYGYRGR
jgi:hypothetical protein